jgi:hypothetical protein
MKNDEASNRGQKQIVETLRIAEAVLDKRVKTMSQAKTSVKPA